MERGFPLNCTGKKTFISFGQLLIMMIMRGRLLEDGTAMELSSVTAVLRNLICFIRRLGETI